MSYKNYPEKLKDPRWQKKRLEIFNRDAFKCVWCGNTEKTLHVHHFCYEKGKEPWEAFDDELATLCEDCHMLKHIKLSAELQEIFDLVSSGFFMQSPLAAQAIVEIIKKYTLK